MTAVQLDGRQVAASIFDEIGRRIHARLEGGGSRPHLAVVLVGDDPASETYVRMKRKNSEDAGIESPDYHLPSTAATDEVLGLVERLNDDPAVSGILVQAPLPAQIDSAAVMERIDPARDVDGLTPYNAGRLAIGSPNLVPCTPAGIIELLDRYGIELAGRHAVVIGRSNLVGKPVSLLLLYRHATVTICHSRTPDLAAESRRADVLVAAAGQPHLVQRDWVKPGAAVIDVGVSRVDGKLVGDVEPEVAEVAGWLTPNPGGVGPMTRAMLLLNTLRAEELRRPLPS
ncbi:MAG TPA: bifunctional 5,10-methylenetetrahydrofolate dehydrogenase/5,10-methenyltetrahydrofolate cyclohydrolase [Candidatus Dormibacteraeota bacterium]